jgi:hypothetical protein
MSPSNRCGQAGLEYEVAGCAQCSDRHLSTTPESSMTLGVGDTGLEPVTSALSRRIGVVRRGQGRSTKAHRCRRFLAWPGLRLPRDTAGFDPEGRTEDALFGHQQPVA